MKPLSVYYESFGCQMNASDTETIAAALAEAGHVAVPAPEDAEVIVVNTCSVRDHAEARALGRLADLSRHRGAAIVVCGCMAERLKERLFELAPAVRVVAGPGSYARIAAAITESVASGERCVLSGSEGDLAPGSVPRPLGGTVSRSVTVIRGCESFCSYCIVPYLRGPLRSVAPEAIVGEIAALAGEGAHEVTLLGQNVMAYRHGDVDFPALVELVLERTTIDRLRFLTSHPRDVDERLFRVMARDGRLCPHLHLPLQAGSDRILRLMNRGYTKGEYLAILDRARRMAPDLAVTTDLIVGFPGESEADFRETLHAVRAARFEAAFTFKYSPREGTAAAAFPDDVPALEKADRLRILNDLVSSLRAEILGGFVGSTAEILLDGAVQKGEDAFRKGRTPQFRNVIVPAGDLRDGQLISVRLARLRTFTYEGEVLGVR